MWSAERRAYITRVARRPLSGWEPEFMTKNSLAYYTSWPTARIVSYS